MEALQELLTDQLRDLYDAEKQLTKALPRLAKAASHPELKQAFTEHTEVTKNQVARLEEIFDMLGEKAKGKPCKGMKGLVEEGQDHISEHRKGEMLDCAIIAASARVEHYEIAGYLAARATAKVLGNREVANLLQETLKEEEQTGKLLMQIGDRLQKEMLAAGGEEEEEMEEPPAAKKAAKKASKRGGSGSAPKSVSRQGGASKGASSRGSGAASGGSSASSIVSTDHDEIREWAEARGAKPAAVKGTGKKGDTGLLRLDFPGYSGGDSLQEITWEEFFEKFDEQGLALLHQETTAAGEQSNFNKIVARETAESGGGSARGKGGSKKSGGRSRR